MALPLRLRGAPDVGALERALGEIVRRHEALRTVFREVDGRPVQVIAPSGAFALPVEDLSELSEADREAAVRRRAGEEAARPFDLAAAPPFRARLLRLGAEHHALFLTVHHIAFDGWSTGLFFGELSRLYGSFLRGEPDPLPEPVMQAVSWAVEVVTPFELHEPAKTVSGGDPVPQQGPTSTVRPGPFGPVVGPGPAGQGGAPGQPAVSTPATRPASVPAGVPGAVRRPATSVDPGPPTSVGPPNPPARAPAVSPPAGGGSTPSTTPPTSVDRAGQAPVGGTVASTVAGAPARRP